MVNRTRQGKRILGRHSTLIEGLDEFLSQLETWPEVRSVHVRHFTKTRNAGRSGGLTFRATRWEFIGPMKLGIRCIATYGSTNQIVTLKSDDLQKLYERLAEEGLCDNFS
jgi:hypothetical protein